MELQLKNIGMIKEANVKFDGLTVIAGENDTGKSTLGKALYLILSYHSSLNIILENEINNNSQSSEKLKESAEIFMAIQKNIFKNQIFGFITIDYGNNYKFTLECNGDKSNFPDMSFFYKPRKLFLQPIMVETPLVWNFTDFFRDIAQIESQMRIELDYPYLMKDLNFKLHIKSASSGLDIKEKVTSLMGGEFKKDEMGRYYFDKQGKRIELVNTATGIKYFGIFQVLSQNNYLNENTVLVLDEPEVHLHPKWQLEMAKIIVELVKNGVKVLVNSHSPYMIEALERYAEKAEVSADFYLAEDGLIDKVEDNNSKTLAKIFHKLSAPYETFNQMDSEILKGG